MINQNQPVLFKRITLLKAGLLFLPRFHNKHNQKGNKFCPTETNIKLVRKFPAVPEFQESFQSSIEDEKFIGSKEDASKSLQANSAFKSSVVFENGNPFLRVKFHITSK